MKLENEKLVTFKLATVKPAILNSLAAALCALVPACAPEPGLARGGEPCLNLLADLDINPFYLTREEIRAAPQLGAVTWYCEYTEGETDAPCLYDDATIVAFADETGVDYFALFASSPIAPVGEVFCLLPNVEQ